MNITKQFFMAAVVVTLQACETLPEDKGVVVESDVDNEDVQITDFSHTRTIAVGENVIELKPDEYVSWKCREFSGGSRTLVEFGKISNSKIQRIIDEFKKEIGYQSLNEDKKEEADSVINALEQWSGFVLYEGTDEGDMAFYERRGINRRWDWGPDGVYSFIIKPDGVGLFYDFTTADNGRKKKADDVYKCEK